MCISFFIFFSWITPTSTFPCFGAQRTASSPLTRLNQTNFRDASLITHPAPNLFLTRLLVIHSHQSALFRALCNLEHATPFQTTRSTPQSQPFCNYNTSTHSLVVVSLSVHTPPQFPTLKPLPPLMVSHQRSLTCSCPSHAAQDYTTHEKGRTDVNG